MIRTVSKSESLGELWVSSEWLVYGLCVCGLCVGCGWLALFHHDSIIFIGTNNAHNIVHSKSHIRPKSNSMRFGQQNSRSLPNFQYIAGICHLNNLHELYHLSFCPTASQYRECSFGLQHWKRWLPGCFWQQKQKRQRQTHWKVGECLQSQAGRFC